MDYSPLRPWFLVALLFALMVGCSSAFAIGFVQKPPAGSSLQWEYRVNSGATTPAPCHGTGAPMPQTSWYGSPAAALAAQASLYGNGCSVGTAPAARSDTPSTLNQNATVAQGTLLRGGFTNYYNMTAQAHLVSGEAACPPDSTENAGNCICNSGFRPAANVSSGVFDACSTYTCEDGVAAIESGLYGPYAAKKTLGTTYVCEAANDNGNSLQGCVSKQVVESNFSGADGWYTDFSRTTTGNTCDSDQGNGSSESSTDEQVPDEERAEPECTGGKVPGTVNGSTVCVDPGKAESTDKVTQNPDGTTTTETTVCTNGTCVTTKVTRDSNGTVTGTSSSSQSQSQYCAANPGASICGGSSGSGGSGGDGGGGFCEENPELAICGDSSFAGSCPSFTCDGDAVQCAIAREQHIRNCRLFDSETSPSALTTAGQGALVEDAGRLGDAGQPMAGVSGTPGNPLKVNVGAMFSSMPANPWSESCPPDQPITLFGRAFVIPLAAACPSLQVLGYIAVAFTLVMCSLWLVRAGDK